MADVRDPGETTREELVAQLAAVTAEMDALRALRPRDPHRTGHRCVCCGREGARGADDVCPWCDALRAAARAAGWSDADATGETLVAWVRRGELESMLATARREGAEEMRWAASEAAEQWLIEVEEVTQDSPADLADAIRALPLDAAGGEP